MSLVEQIRSIEERFGETGVRFGVPGEHEECGRLGTGWADIDRTLGGGLLLAALHEWFGVALSEPSITGRNDETPRRTWTPPLLPIVHLVKRLMSRADFAGQAVWIGRRCFPYGGALPGAENDPRFLERSVFVAPDRSADRLWTIDLGLRCGAVGIVVADGSGFDMAATRRIQLVAKAHHTPALLVRPPWEACELSAAQTRWLVRFEANSESVSDEFCFHLPQWSVELLRCKGRQADSCPRWVLEWNRGEGAVRLSTALAGATGEAGASTNDCRLQHA